MPSINTSVRIPPTHTSTSTYYVYSFRGMLFSELEAGRAGRRKTANLSCETSMPCTPLARLFRGFLILKNGHLRYRGPRSERSRSFLWLDAKAAQPLLSPVFIPFWVRFWVRVTVRASVGQELGWVYARTLIHQRVFPSPQSNAIHGRHAPLKIANAN